MKWKLQVEVFLYLIPLLTSCIHDPGDISGVNQVCFQSDILPVFQNSCGTSGCHDVSSKESGFDATSYAGILAMIEPGNASNSKAYKAILGRWVLMPPHGALSKDIRTKIWFWIEQGANETTCITEGGNGEVSGISYACFSRDIFTILSGSCAISGCHNSQSAKDGINLSTYQSVITTGKVTAGKPGESDLYNAITRKPGEDNFMPPTPYSPLSKAATDSIYSWIARGAKNEICAAICDTAGTITWSKQVKNVMDVNCISCHNGSNPSGGVLLATFENVKSVAQSGKLVAVVKRLSGQKPMPPAIALSVCNVRKIELWINQLYQP